jgi:hypothetical protein
MSRRDKILVESTDPHQYQRPIGTKYFFALGIEVESPEREKNSGERGLGTESPTRRGTP